MGRRITSGHWFSRPIIAEWWRYYSLSVVAALVLVSALPTPTAQGNYDQLSGLDKAMLPQEGSTPVAAPQAGSQGSVFTVSASGFRSYAVVESIKLGGVSVLGNRTINTDADGNFTASGLQVPGLDPGRYALVVTVGSGNQKTTAAGTFEVTAQKQGGASGSPEAGLAPLLDADNLERVFYFRNSTKDWLFYDPRPEFAAANTLEELRDGAVYWLKVKEDQDVTLNGKAWTVSCSGKGTPSENCWNQVVW